MLITDTEFNIIHKRRERVKNETITCEKFLA